MRKGVLFAAAWAVGHLVEAILLSLAWGAFYGVGFLLRPVFFDLLGPRFSYPSPGVFATGVVLTVVAANAVRPRSADAGESPDL